MSYIISEVQNVNSTRKGFQFSGDLTAAKRKASSEQFFQGTVMKIETESGVLVAYKENGKWHNA